MERTWFITGASRGLGMEIAREALRVGDRVVATARDRNAAVAACGPEGDRMFPVALDVTDPRQAQDAVAAAVNRFGSIDVLVNNAGYGQMGFFEENTIEEARTQFETNLFGVLQVSWAVLPVMRAARKGQIFNISSLGGIRGAATGSLYCASKFALEGFSESLAQEIAPFGLSVTIVEPGYFRTDFLSEKSSRFGGRTISDYAERSAQLRSYYRKASGHQRGNPQALAAAIVTLAGIPAPPMRFAAGSDAFAAIETKLKAMRDKLEEWRCLSLSTDYPDAN